MKGDKRILRQGWPRHAGAVKLWKWWFQFHHQKLLCQ